MKLLRLEETFTDAFNSPVITRFQREFNQIQIIKALLQSSSKQNY